LNRTLVAVPGIVLALALGVVAPVSASSAACKIIICGQKAQALPDPLSQLNATIAAVREITATHEVTDDAWLAAAGDVIGDYLSARLMLLRTAALPLAYDSLVAATQAKLDALLDPLIGVSTASTSAFDPRGREGGGVLDPWGSTSFLTGHCVRRP
jgi:hypothetical protein